MTARFTAIVALLALAGCSILNDPDEGLIERDAGITVDANMDGGGVDARTDGGVDACLARFEDCTNSVDDDCDGLVDCADYDCADQRQCCSDETEDTDDWSESTVWSVFPSGAGIAPSISGTEIVSFREGAGPIGLVTRDCVPMALGLELWAPMRVEGGNCPTGEGSSCYGQLVVTGAVDSEAGTSILRDFAAGLDGEGYFQVMRGNDVIARRETPVPAGTTVDVRIILGPGLDGNTPALVGTASLTIGTTEEIFAPSEFVVTLDDLETELGPCAQTPGLFVAVQGEGTRVRVGRLTRITRECINPNVFRQHRDDRSRLVATDTGEPDEVSLGFDDWCAGGLGAPALFGIADVAGTQWDVFVDGTNADRALYPTNTIGFGLGQAHTNQGAWATTWTTTEDMSMNRIPKLGICEPSCLPGVPGAGCDTGGNCAGPPPHYREPSVHADLTSADLVDELWLAYAREFDADEQRFEIVVQNLLSAQRSATTSIMATGITVVGADQLTTWGCQSARDPALVARGGDSDNGFWLFFTCERLGAPSEIHVVHLSSGLDRGDHEVVLTRDDVGDYGSGGVRAPEVLVEYDGAWPTRGLYRMWFTARRTGVSTLALAQGQTTTEDVTASPDGLPLFAPYPANPVLTAGSEILRPGCAGSCPLTGMAVARDPFSGENELRFLVARSVQGTGGGNYELVPLVQFWRSPWDAM